MTKMLIALLIGLLPMTGAVLPAIDSLNEMNIGNGMVPDSPNAPVTCRINSDAEFIGHPCITPGGSGTPSNPYVIQGRDINGTDYAHAIYIGNTTAFFTIKNNHLHHVNGTTGLPYYSNDGLLLYNVTNGKVENNNFDNESDGLRFDFQAHGRERRIGSGDLGRQ